MLSEQEIKQALRASRVIPMAVSNPHGPVGWDHLAHELARFLTGQGGPSVVKTLELPVETWQKLERLADEAAKAESRPVSVSEMAVAILQHYTSGNR